VSVPIARLYDGVAQPWLDVLQVRDALAAWLPGLAREVRGPLLHAADDHERHELAERLCHMRVQNPMRSVAPRRPLKLEVDVEERLLAGASRPTPGVLYDGNELQRLAFTRLPREERLPDAVHVWFTERLVATWDHADRRYHARVIVCGLPAIVSTAGMVQAPARQREFYIARRLGLSDEQAAAAATEDFLNHEDPRTTEVAKGYALQAALFSLLGEGFCDQPGCRLFNAHWQREMLAAQLEGDDFCPAHRRMLDACRDGNP
jgi:hypothetical protein